MKESRHDKIRVMLLNSSDGLTTSQIAKQLGSTYKSVQKTMNNIYGVYIDRWDVPRHGQFAAVWMCVEVPDDVPHPTDRYLPKPTTLWQNNSPYKKLQ